MQSTLRVCPILTKFEVGRHIFAQVPNTIFTEIRPLEAALIRTDRHDEANRRLLLFTRTRQKKKN